MNKSKLKQIYDSARNANERARFKEVKMRNAFSDHFELGEIEDDTETNRLHSSLESNINDTLVDALFNQSSFIKVYQDIQKLVLKNKV